MEEHIYNDLDNCTKKTEYILKELVGETNIQVYNVCTQNKGFPFRPGRN